ncbi:hypothetical protein DOY81_007620 [Sarcophaga bullata]|nr:hypothetical protein DOY81_007620 [Sarcophaga bullata]
MTDSMKFGPEWLRNMSADTASSNSTNSNSQITNSGGSSASSGSSGDGTSNNNNGNNNNSSNLNTTSSNLHNSVNSANSGPLRNTFPEFRYGREEMLLLFDRNCGIPEILPSFKHLFVERVQFPLALVPSTDEELMQGSAPPTQRPVWLQRSPVGFSTSSRGTGRVGCMERGRIRGKSMYHPVFQRPNAMFEDDQRPSAIKTERPWAERNGGAAGCDPTLAGPATIGGLGSSDSWNGNTPASSPRREFSNHPRNMENWRRSRNEDGSSGGDAGTTSATFSAEGGWRMNTSGFQNSHMRWGRSTSWRDDDLTNTNENSGIGSSIVGNSAGIMMMRSNSTIATTHGERVGQSGISNKQSIGTSGGGMARSISMTTSVSRNSSSCNIWPSNSNISQIANTQGDGGGSDDTTLPEWAMENPSDIGGTFDASGAFHGTIDDDENLVCNTGGNNSNSPDQLQPPPSTAENQISEKDCREKPTNVTGPPTKTIKENDNCQEPSPRCPTPSNATPSLKNSDGFSECEKPKQNIKITSEHNITTPENICQKNMSNKSKNEFSKESSITSTITTTTSTVPNYEDGTSTSEDNTTNSSNVGDYAERMMKVTDDMIEKLIMDDDDSKDDHMKLSGGCKGNSQNSFVAGMQQSQNSNHHPSTVSPAVVPGGPAGPPNMGIYNMAGIMVDHPHNIAALHQLQQQQMAAVAAAAIGLQPTPPPPPHAMNCSSPTDLWLYRDPQAKVQGPFSALEMTEWYRAGYFNENLFVRRACDARYRPLGELIKICGGQMPFSNTHLIPLDLNPTPLHTPIVPVITAQPQANDFVLKSLSEDHQQQQHEKLKGNVTAAADSLSNALKSLMNSVDISQVLNMHFQTLQDRFIHNQEMEIVSELSKNECFQRMSAAEQDAVVRQKLQMMVLPEYLTNLTGLSNSLAALNPSAGTQLYDTIAECTKKEQLFNNNQSQPQVQGQQQQQRNNHHGSSSTSYMNAEDFIMKTKNSNHDVNTSDLLNEFNLRMFLNNGSDATGDRGGVGTPNSQGHEFLNEQQMFGSGPAVSGATSTPNSASNTSQSPMMQMWMNSLAANQTTPLPSQQHPVVVTAQQSGAVNNQWLNGPLVGISTISLSREQHTGGSIMGSPKPTPTSMWDVATLEQHVQVQQQQQHEQQMVLQLQQQTSFEDQHHLPVVEKIPQQDNVIQQPQDNSKQSNQQQNVEKSKQQEPQQQKSHEIQKTDKTSPKLSLSNDNKSEQNNRQSQQGIVNEKSNQQNKRNSNNNNNGGIKSTNKATKNENTEQTAVKKSEEERRREQNEEKRRQKEEKKRQQMEEDKRRLLQAEEEKRRQMQEEEKRQQQIQAQRRKALMGNNASNASNNGSNAILSSPNSNQKSIKEQHRIQSSVAPWSTQTMTSKLQGPGLAEIQKAERRERRADQQRQLEIQEKQMRALAAAAEVQDTVLKWNAAPVPVKSFAEIQAEEAKRLAHEQMEIQKRKEQDAHSNVTAFSSGTSSLSGALSSSSNMASIWSGNKIWGTPANTAGFWEEPFKYNNKSVGSGLSNSNNINNCNVTATLIASQSPTTQKSTTSQTPTISASQQQMSNKNIKKSQSVAVMQNASTPPNGSGASSNQKKSNSSRSNKPKSQISDNNGSGNEKKSAHKNNNNTNSANKCDDYEAEFVNWCTKSLHNMNAKVDVPTFVSFLRDLESPYEVKDYIRMYLGESKEYIDFAKQFLERRSKYKNLQRAQNAHDDDLCKPALAITPSVNDNSDNKGKQKKVKKNKMTNEQEFWASL